MTIQSILGTLSAEEFLAKYWQKKPLLIRNAFRDFKSPLTADELAGLSLEEEVESRIVFEAGESGPWEVQHGPFDEEIFALLPESCWSLLVQGVDLWVPEVKALLTHFNFLPRWRIDDVMVSYAPVGGSVGPHFDYYDVFLLQGQGQRRWQIGSLCDQQSPLLPETQLRILQAFDVKEEWILNPGDMLYLPPGISHWGVAENDCLTYSIGFRSPTLTDMLDDLTTELMAQGNSSYYRDPPLTPSMATEAIDPAFITQVQVMLKGLAEDKALLSDWFARYMTAPKYPDLVDEADGDRRASIAGKAYLNGEQVDK
ncbi:cupin domain-containing protein [Porticoccus sp.]|uniref:cupin domain-containing protein n=1 Tax=Porticoccus sp. TaxID=2024853 RepID=UPI003F69E216